MGLTLETAPAVEPVTIDEAKQHLRILGTEENAYLERLIKAARHKVENDTGRALITQKWKLSLDCFPRSRKIYLERPPLRSVESVKYYDPAGNLTTISASDYILQKTGTVSYIELKSGLSWPDTRDERLAVEIIFEAGYGSDRLDVDPQLRHAILFLLSHWFSMREPVVAGLAPAVVPQTYDFLVLPLKVYFPHD